MTARKCFIVAAGLMTAGAAHAEDIPSNAELFRMLKAQQQTISELRAELKQAKQERRAATPRETAAPTVRPAGGDVATVAATPPAQAYAMYNKGPAVVPTRSGGAYVGVFGGGGSRGGTDVSQFGTVFIPEAAAWSSGCRRHGTNQQWWRWVRRCAARLRVVVWRASAARPRDRRLLFGG